MEVARSQKIIRCYCVDYTQRCYPRSSYLYVPKCCKCYTRTRGDMIKLPYKKQPTGTPLRCAVFERTINTIMIRTINTD